MFYYILKENYCILLLQKLRAANAHFKESLHQNAQLYFQICDCKTGLFQPASNFFLISYYFIK